MEIKTINFQLSNPFNSTDAELNLQFIYPALQEFKKLKVPVNTAYNTVKSIGIVEKALKDYDEVRKSICESLCDKDAQDKPIIEAQKYKFTPENQIEFNKKWQELLNTEITLDIWPINQSDISHLKEINITCYETLLNHGFIKEDTQTTLKPTNGKADKKEVVHE